NSGRNDAIVESSIKSMISKYEKSDLLNKDEKEEFILLLEKTIGFINFKKIEDSIRNRKIIIWGTGGSYRRFNKNTILDFEFFVDSDENKLFKNMDGKQIYMPQKLLEINKHDYYILVLSQFYAEIYS